MTIIDRRYSVAEGLAAKAPCRVATTANITLSGLQTIDGVTVAANDRVLVKNQTTGSQNGIYDASSGNWTRARDFDGALDVVTGTKVLVTAGSVGAGVEYYVSTTGTITIDTTSITFTSITATAVASAAAAAASASTASTQATNAAASAAAAAASAASAVPPPVPYAAGMLNGTIVETRLSNAVTFTIKTLAGATPSSSDKVRFLFRNVTVGSGDYSLVELTSALSITISSGSTLGFTSSVASRLWLIAINNGGTPELAVINCLSGASVYPLNGWGIISTTAEGGAGAADSAHVAYSTTLRSAKPYVVLGYASYEGGLGTAGTWNAAPTRIQLFGPGAPLPGTVVQIARTNTSSLASGTTVMPADDTIPQNTEGDEYMTQAITPTSACNALSVKTRAHIASGATYNVAALFRDATAGAVAATMNPNGANVAAVEIDTIQLAGTSAATTFKFRAGPQSAATMNFNGTGGSRYLGGVMNSFIEVREIMA